MFFIIFEVQRPGDVMKSAFCSGGVFHFSGSGFDRFFCGVFKITVEHFCFRSIGHFDVVTALFDVVTGH